ncbi:MAG: methyltransferase domain-containing protein [Vicinamibacterales bacterium]
MAAAHTYNDIYYQYINQGSLQSARVLLPLVARHFLVRSVVDFGAGQGAWLRVWQDLGTDDVLGLDGDYVDRSELLIAAKRFVAADLTKPIRLNRTFDLVQSLEVAEHLPSSAAAIFIDNLVAHGKVILFSAAAPGQGGEHHVNERPYSCWRDLFHERHYTPLDMIRPVLARDVRVEPWYRYNSFVFVHDDLLPVLPVELRGLQIAADQEIPDVSPPLYKLRKALFRPLPSSVITQFARLKKHWHVRTSLT